MTRWALATSPVLRVADRRRPLLIPDAQLAAEFGGYQADAVVRDCRTVVLLPLGCTTADEHEMVLSIHTKDCVEVPGEEDDAVHPRQAHPGHAGSLNVPCCAACLHRR